jgi:hypothetical protein
VRVLRPGQGCEVAVRKEAGVEAGRGGKKKVPD